FVHELARRLSGRFEVHALVPHAAGTNTAELMDGVQVHRFRYLPARFETLAYGGGMLPGLRTRPWRLLALPVFLAVELMAAVRLLRRRRYSVVHAHWLLPHGLIAVFARAMCGYRPAIVCTAHGADVYGLRGRFADAVRRYVIARCELVATVSNAMLRTLARSEKTSDRLVVLPMGVDMAVRFVPAASGQDANRLLFVGRLAEKKGLNVLLDALPGLIVTHPRLRLSIIGEGAEEARLRRQVSDLHLTQHVEFTGALTNQELPAWYQRASILVFPSVITSYGDQEGLGLVPIEALACGCAVVASDLPAVRDVIRDGETGLLAAPGDPVALAAAVRKLLDNPAQRQRLAAQGRAYAQAHFDWDGIAARYVLLFDAAVKEITRSGANES
ncbi:MAG TPA: glycosyltransferase, partial [Ktedonobacterales bacterium]|nr:glycosyltransferase [Ktedonobacterales bacterium]